MKRGTYFKGINKFVKGIEKFEEDKCEFSKKVSRKVEELGYGSFSFYEDWYYALDGEKLVFSEEINTYCINQITFEEFGNWILGGGNLEKDNEKFLKMNFYEIY